MKQKLLLTLMFLTTAVYAATAAAFLDNGISARSDALGGAFAGVASDLDAFYYNPAGYGFQSQLRLNTAATRMNNINDVYYAGVGVPFLGGYSAVNYYMTIVPDIPETTIVNGQIQDSDSSFDYSSRAIFLSHGFKLLPNVSLGLSLKYIRESLFRNAATGYGLDAGVLYQWSEDLSFGAAVLNILEPVMQWDTDSKEKNTVERKGKIGIAYKVAPDILLTTETTFGKRDMSTAMGLEYTLYNMFALRAGTQSKNYALGLGFLYADFNLDYVYILPQDELIESTHKVSFGYAFK
jgi:hypothetical protein